MNRVTFSAHPCAAAGRHAYNKTAAQNTSKPSMPARSFASIATSSSSQPRFLLGRQGHVASRQRLSAFADYRVPADPVSMKKIS
jgi:hypothetical protein